MLEIKKISDEKQLADLLAKERLPTDQNILGFSVSDRDTVLGFALFEKEENARCFAVCCEDSPLFDGLVRGMLHYCLQHGAKTMDFSAVNKQETLEKWGFLQQIPLEIAPFFAKGCS